MEVVATTEAIRRAKLQLNRHHEQTNTQFFLQTGCPSCRRINSVKALKRSLHSSHRHKIMEKCCFTSLHYSQCSKCTNRSIESVYATTRVISRQAHCCCWQVGSAPFVRRRCDCWASSAPFTNIQTYLLTYLLDQLIHNGLVHLWNRYCCNCGRLRSLWTLTVT